MTSIKDVHVPWLLYPIWKDFPMTKGLNHHRVPIGIILAADEDITCTLATDKLEQVKVRLFNNDSDTEDLYIIDSTLPCRAAILSSSAASVPFIECEYLDETPCEKRILKVEYPSTSKILPIFHYGDDEDIFFELWDSQEAEFAYIESDYFSLLIPELDKENVRNLPNNYHLDNLILFYNEIFTIYNHLIGLSFESKAINKNVRNRFFLKADKNGAGAAYYCDWWTAESTESISNFWLDLSPTNWGALHEIAHGHELKNLSDETFITNEVWNNILVVFYQYFMLGDDILTKGGLSRKQMIIDDYLKKCKPVTEWGVFQKLSFLMHMFFKTGSKAFTRFNEITRKEWVGNQHFVAGTTFLEKLIQLFAVDFGFDMYPYMKLANVIISNTALFEHYYIFSEVAYPMNHLIDNEDLLNELKNKLHLLYDTSLVTPLDLRFTNLKNTLTVEIDKNIFPILFGQVFKIMDGSRTICEKRIVQHTFSMDSLPIGVYKLYIPLNPFNQQYLFNDFYVIIHANYATKFTISAKSIVNSSLLLDKINFFGLADNPFASLSVDILNNKVKLHVFSEDPHSYFKNEKYASIKIETFDNKTIFEQVFEGTNNTLGVFETPMEDILIVKIYHAETKTRLKTEDSLSHVIINPENNTNILFVNKFGFKNQHTSKEIMAKRHLQKIETAANRIRNLPFLNDKTCCYPKYNLFLAIESYNRLFKKYSKISNMEDQYIDCLPPEYPIINLDPLVNFNKGSLLEILNDDNFYEIMHTESGKKHIILKTMCTFLSAKIIFLGYNDEHVANLYFDSENEIIKFQILVPNAHDRFEGEIYYSVTVRTRSNKTIFHKSIEGTDACVGNFEIPFSQNIEIDIYHAETKRRLKAETSATGFLIDKHKHMNTFRISRYRKKLRRKSVDLLKNCFSNRAEKNLRRSESLDMLVYDTKENLE